MCLLLPDLIYSCAYLCLLVPAGLPSMHRTSRACRPGPIKVCACWCLRLFLQAWPHRIKACACAAAVACACLRQACPQRRGPHVPAAACCACACRPALNAWDLVYLLSVPVFVADMGMQFFVAFTDHATGDLVTEIPKIRLHYIK